MIQVKVASFSVSLDGYGAGIEQDRDNPLGVRGTELHTWLFDTRVFKEMTGQPGGSTGVDNDFAVRGFENVGAWIIGRNMFGPVRGPWPEEPWNGWWGANPPFHAPVYVLTHFAREPLVMEGGTTFHFVTEGSQIALARAMETANGKEIRVRGGVQVIREYAAAGSIDEIHFAVSPTLLGRGENLLAGLDLPMRGFAVSQTMAGEKAFHVVLSRTSSRPGAR